MAFSDHLIFLARRDAQTRRVPVLHEEGKKAHEGFPQPLACRLSDRPLPPCLLPSADSERPHARWVSSVHQPKANGRKHLFLQRPVDLLSPGRPERVPDRHVLEVGRDVEVDGTDLRTPIVREAEGGSGTRSKGAA